VIYVSEIQAGFGRIKRCRMIADNHIDLHKFAQKLRLRRIRCRGDCTPHEHYELTQEQRKLAVAYGAKQISDKDLAQKLFIRSVR
jgi:hypothetical protein